jgi:hypothetical protein
MSGRSSPASTQRHGFPSPCNRVTPYAATSTVSVCGLGYADWANDGEQFLGARRNHFAIVGSGDAKTGLAFLCRLAHDDEIVPVALQIRS